jgi:hypothetical protein
MRVAADQAGQHMIGKIAHDGQFPAVQRGVPEAEAAVRRLDLERDEIAARTGDDHTRIRDRHEGGL